MLIIIVDDCGGVVFILALAFVLLTSSMPFWIFMTSAGRHQSDDLRRKELDFSVDEVRLYLGQ